MSSSETQTPLLEVRDAVVHYGRIEALHGVSVVVRPGELVTLLGSNGAGKTTVFNAITGIYEPSAGRIQFAGHETRSEFRWTTAALLFMKAW